MSDYQDIKRFQFTISRLLRIMLYCAILFALFRAAGVRNVVVSGFVFMFLLGGIVLVIYSMAWGGMAISPFLWCRPTNAT